MIIIRLSGGLGNQMFQYALYQAFLAQGVEARLDRSKFKHIDEKRECFIDYECFDLEYRLCSKKEARKYVIGTGMTARVIAKCLGDKKTHIYEKLDYVYDESILDLREGYLEGFWQSWKYSENVHQKLRKCFKFVNELAEKNKIYEDIIKKTNSVAIHVRRGDYLKLPNIYGNICTEAYYKNAIKMIERLVEKPTYYFFSNDLEWTMCTFGEADNYIYVAENEENKGYIDMRLMSECKHQIIANSSFSWWSAFLNNNPDKKVICPSRWINTRETPDIYFEDWIRISG